MDVLQVGNNLRTMEISEDKASQRENETTAKIQVLTEKLAQISEAAEKFESQVTGLEATQDQLEGIFH